MSQHFETSVLPIEAIADQPARTYRVAGEYRRSLIYVAIGGIVILALLALVPRPNPQPIELGRLVVVGLVYVTLPLAAWLYLTTWRLRIDESGLWRRRLGRWTCWTWETIASGKVRFGSKSGILWNRSGPWWDSAIGVGLLGREGAFVLGVLERLLAEGATNESDCSEPIPTEVAIRTWFPFQWIRVRPDGIELQRSGKTAFYPWEQVERLRFVRYPQGECYVHLIELDLSGGLAIHRSVAGVRIDQRGVLRVHSRSAAWVRQLASIVPNDKWQCLDMTGDVRSIEEASYRTEFWRKKQGPLRLFPWIGIALSAFAGMKFIPGMWALWNVQQFPILWKFVALAIGVWMIAVPSILFFLLPRYFRTRMEEYAQTSEKELELLLATQASKNSAAASIDFRRMFQAKVQS